MTQPAGSALQDRESQGLLGQRQFKAMGTNIELYCRDVEDVGLLAAAELLFHSMEARLSRFKPASELCSLNDRCGQVTTVSDVLFDVLERAMQLHEITGGVFDPAVLPALEASGYDRSFEQVEPESPGTSVQPEAERHSISELLLNSTRMTVLAPPGLRLDLGGIGKGFTADRAANMLAPVENFVVNAGGDIYASGAGPDGDGWLVAVTDPQRVGQHISLVRLHDEALATSTTALRRWQRGDEVRHHLIDPKTGHPSGSGVLAVSVIAPSATEADVFAKTALLLGASDGARFLEAQSTTGLFVLDDGACLPSAGWTGTPTI